METPEERKVRLAQALRVNLRRRKAQAREQADGTVPPATPPESTD
jgi:hypothetical protein